jgi:FHA domain
MLSSDPDHRPDQGEGRAMTTHVGVQSGDGLVARFGDAVVVVGPAVDESFTNALLAAVEAADGAGRAAADLAWDIAALLGQHRDSAPAFGLAAPVAEGQLLLLHGSAQATAGDVHLTGQNALTWVDHVLTDLSGPIALTVAEDAAVHPSPRSDLRGGMVPGNGAVLTLPQVATSTAPDEAVETPGDTSGGELEAEPNGDEDDQITRATAPWSITENDEAPAAEPDLAEASAPADIGTADGTTTADNLEPTAAIAAPAVASEPARETMAAGPATAALVSDEGARAPLDRPYVLGREPQYDEAVARGAASPIVIPDPDNMISRVQAYVWVDRNGVLVRDAKSANGTFVAAPGATDWVRLTDEPALLPVGWSLRIGRRVFTHVGPPQS